MVLKNLLFYIYICKVIYIIFIFCFYYFTYKTYKYFKGLLFCLQIGKKQIYGYIYFVF